MRGVSGRQINYGPHDGDWLVLHVHSSVTLANRILKREHKSVIKSISTTELTVKFTVQHRVDLDTLANSKDICKQKLPNMNLVSRLNHQCWRTRKFNALLHPLIDSGENSQKNADNRFLDFTSKTGSVCC